MRAEEGGSQRSHQTLMSATMTLLSLLRVTAPELGDGISAAAAACGAAEPPAEAPLYPVVQPDDSSVDICIAACTGQLPRLQRISQPPCDV